MSSDTVIQNPANNTTEIIQQVKELQRTPNQLPTKVKQSCVCVCVSFSGYGKGKITPSQQDILLEQVRGGSGLWLLCAVHTPSNKLGLSLPTFSVESTLPLNFIFKSKCKPIQHTTFLRVYLLHEQHFLVIIWRSFGSFCFILQVFKN